MAKAKQQQQDDPQGDQIQNQDQDRDQRARLRRNTPPRIFGTSHQEPEDEPPVLLDWKDLIRKGIRFHKNHLRRKWEAGNIQYPFADALFTQQLHRLDPVTRRSHIPTPAPSHTCVDADGNLISAAEAKAEWERKTGEKTTPITGEPPPSSPPTLDPVTPFGGVEDAPPDDDEYDPQARLEKFRASPNGMHHMASLRPPPMPPVSGSPRPPTGGINMNDLARAIPRIKWK